MKKTHGKYNILAAVLAASMVLGNCSFAYAKESVAVAAGQSVEDITRESADADPETGHITGQMVDTDPETGHITGQAADADPETGDLSGEVEDMASDTVEAASSTEYDTETGTSHKTGRRPLPDGFEVPAGNPDLTFRQARSMLVDDGDEILEDVGATLESAYPCSYTDTSGIKSYVGTYLMPLRDQGDYGTCWAHATTSLIEGYLLFHGMSDLDGPVDRKVNYSELQLAYFYYHNNKNPITGDDGGDTLTMSGSSDAFLNLGGNELFAVQAFINWIGAVSEDDVPYSKAKSVIKNGLDEKYTYEYDKAHLTNAYIINIGEDPDAVKEAIKENGLVDIAFYADDNYYSDDYNSYYCRYNSYANHAVTVVGWDDDFPASNFGRTSKGDGAWLVRNSWTSTEKTLGFDGYFWLSYYDKTIDTAAYAFEAAAADNYDNNYFHANQIHNQGNWSFTKVANVFTVAGGEDREELKAVAAEVMKAGVGYTVSIYAVDSSGVPTSTKLTSDVTGTFPYAGTYTIPLAESVFLDKGEKFAVAIETEESGTIVSEYSMSDDDCTIEVTANSGESFYYSNGWIDYANLYKSNPNIGNFCINAFTCNVDTPVTPKASDFTFVADNASYDGNAHAAVITPRSALSGGMVTVYYSTDGNTWSTEAPVYPGTYYVAIDYPAVGNYLAVEKLTDSSWTLTISKRDISDATVSGIVDKEYTGEAITQTFTVTVDSMELTENTDYTVTYADNTEKGTATVTLMGIGYFTGTLKKTFRIIKKVTGVSLDKTALDVGVGYTSVLTANVTPSDATDVSVSWSSSDTSVAVVSDGKVTGVSKGNAVITVTTNDGGYTDVCDVTVKKAQIASNFVFSAEGGVYNGSAYTASVTPVSEIEGGTAVVYYSDRSDTPVWTENAPVNAGTYLVAVDYPTVGEYAAVEKLTDAAWSFTIDPKYISDATVTGITDKDYTGEALTQEFTVKDGTTLLVEDTDYTVSYSDNVNKGTAVVTITGMGNYTGSVRKTFEIIKRVTGVSLSKSKVYIQIGKTKVLKATVSPYDANDQTVSWKSGDESMLTVEDGTITPVGRGTTTVTVTTNDGGFTASATVRVLAEGETVGDPEIYGDEDGYAEEKAAAGGDEPGLWIGEGFSEEYVYTGAAIKPTPNVYYGSRLLLQGTDYNISYKNNTNVDATGNKVPQVIVKGKGQYSGKADVSFGITKASFEDNASDFVISSMRVAVAGTKAQKPVPVITYKGKKLSVNKDFVVTYLVDNSRTDSVALGDDDTREFKALIQGCGDNFTGSTVVDGCLYLKKSTEIIFIPVSKLKIGVNDCSLIYDGKEKKPSVTVSCKYKDALFYMDSDQVDTYFDVTYGNNVNAGKGKLTITGKAPYTETFTYDDVTYEGDTYVFTGSRNVTFSIGKYDISNSIVELKNLDIDNYNICEDLVFEKTGAKPEPLVYMTDSEGNESDILKQGKDFKVSYKYNKYKNEIYMTVKGVKNCTGTALKTVYMDQKLTLSGNVTVVAEDVPVGTDPRKTKVTVYDTNGNVLKKGTDYIFNPNVDVEQTGTEGEYSVRIHGAGAFANSDDYICTIRTYDKAYKLSAARQEKKLTKDYTGSAVELSDSDLTGLLSHKEVFGALKPCTDDATDGDFQVAAYQKNIKAGTAKAILKGTGKFGGTKVITFKIVKKAIG